MNEEGDDDNENGASYISMFNGEIQVSVSPWNLFSLFIKIIS